MPELLFCAICQVSIAAAEIDRGDARRTPRGRTFCRVCATSSPDERIRRRAALEQEFADDAPVPLPIGAPRRAAQAVSPPPLASPPPLPAPPPLPQAPPPALHDPMVELRVGELERAVFRLQARVATLEERLARSLHEGSRGNGGGAGPT